jgi:hypothetical protein
MNKKTIDFNLSKEKSKCDKENEQDTVESLLHIIEGYQYVSIGDIEKIQGLKKDENKIKITREVIRVCRCHMLEGDTALLMTVVDSIGDNYYQDKEILKKLLLQKTVDKSKP